MGRIRSPLAPLVAILVALVALAVAIANGASVATTTVVQAPSSAQRTALVKAAVSTPNPACNPALGHGDLGICHPPTAPLAAAFGARTKTLGGTLGVDVSNNQGCGYRVPRVAFLFVKLNEGSGFRDRCAAGFAAQGRQLGAKVGGYDFMRPGHQSASSEAAVFVSQYRAARLTGPAVPDVEVNDRGVSQAGVRAYVNEWARYVHAHLPRATIIVYTGKWFWDPQVAGAAGSSNLWIAAYANSFFLPTGFRSALIWQYSDGRFGPAPHLGGVDSNVFLGSRARFDAVFAGSKPITAGMRKRCVELNTLRRHSARYHRHYHLRPVKPLSRRQHRRALAIKRGEHHRGIVCKVGPPGRRGTISRR